MSPHPWNLETAPRYTLVPAWGLAGLSVIALLLAANLVGGRSGDAITPRSKGHQPPTQHDAAGGTTPDDAPAHDPPPPALADRSTDELVALLRSDDAEQRTRAAEALAVRSPYEVVPRLGPWVEEAAADEASDDALIAALLTVYRGMGVADAALLGRALAARDDATRALAVATLGDWWGRTPDRLAKLTAAAEDRSMGVRLEALRVCVVADNAQAAGIAQLIALGEMDDAMQAEHAQALQHLARHGRPVPATSRRMRLRAMAYDGLLDEPRDAPALAAMLLHPGQPAEAFAPTLQEAAQLAQTDALTTLTSLLADATDTQLRAKPRLGETLAHWPADELAEQPAALERLAAEAPDTLRPALDAARARALLRDPGEPALAQARAQLGDAALLAAAPLIPEAGTRDRLLPVAREVLAAEVNPEDAAASATRAAAVYALPHLPAAAATLHDTLVELATAHPDTATRFAAIDVLDQRHAAGDGPAPPAALTLTRVELRAVPNQMQYDPAAFTVTAGRPVELVFINPDTMEHNLLIAAPGRLTDVGLDAALLGEQAGRAVDYIPDSPHVLHAMPILPPGETDTLRFIAPDEPGDYPYVCTYPSHWTTMNGVMRVEAP